MLGKRSDRQDSVEDHIQIDGDDAVVSIDYIPVDQITKHKNVVAEKNEDHSSKALPKSVKERYSEGGLSKRERKRLAK